MKSRIEKFTSLKEVYGYNVIPKSSFYDWYKKFEERLEECNDAPPSG